MEIWIIFVEVTSLYPWICETRDSEVSQNANELIKYSNWEFYSVYPK